MSNAMNVTTAKPKVGGAIYTAPAGTTLPTNALDTLDAAFKSLGYAAEEGLVNTSAMESQEIKAWGGDTVAVPITSKVDTFKYTLIEAMNTDVLKEVYGSGNVSGTLEAGITIKANAQDLSAHPLIFDMILKDGVLKRVVVPNGKVTGVGDITYVDGEAIGYETTIRAIPDEDGNTHYEYIQKPTIGEEG